MTIMDFSELGEFENVDELISDLIADITNLIGRSSFQKVVINRDDKKVEITGFKDGSGLKLEDIVMLEGATFENICLN